MSIFICLLYMVCGLNANNASTQRILTLSEAINRMALQTKRIRAIKLAYENCLLDFANYRKGFLPAVSFSISPFSFNRSIQRLQEASDGSYTYVEDYSNSSSAGITVRQKIGPTGGTLTMGTSLSFLREFSANRNSFNSRPIYIGFTQPLTGGYKEYIFNRTIQHLTQTIAAKDCAKEIATFQYEVLSTYLKAYLADQTLRNAISMEASSDTLLHIALLKLKAGRITDYEYKQVDLQCAENAYDAATAREERQMAVRALSSCLELDGDPIALPQRLDNCPPVIETSTVHALIAHNNPQYIQAELDLARARQQLWQAKQATRLSGNLSIDYGVNQYGAEFAQAYRHPSRQQSVSVTLSLPVFQWGINHNKRQIAENEFEIQRIATERSLRDFDKEIDEVILRYNSALLNSDLSERAFRLATENYHMMARRFTFERITVAELIEAKRTLMMHQMEYYTAIQSLYTTYYNIRTLTLYDFENNKHLQEAILPNL